VEISAREVLGACSTGRDAKRNLGALRRFAEYEPIDSIALRHSIAARLLGTERYTV